MRTCIYAKLFMHMFYFVIQNRITNCIALYIFVGICNSICRYTNGFAYVKFIIIWLFCIMMDIIIGFRFELLYPIWLIIRYIYDSCKFKGILNSFHSPAFVIFFVFATAVADFICYILIPVQLILFIASSYVWLYLIYQIGIFFRNLVIRLKNLKSSRERVRKKVFVVFSERGLGTSHLLISFLLIILEYNWRYRGESFFAPFRGTALGYLISLFVGKYFL
ncbi:unnamed protein product [Dracunculus medinensis]|uniref:7TM_GPCR_Srx domain-containing protein n=1 Tax=Dracunculus medinensis TaxID=318479 RepID=A0A0N4U5R4_DRAME|nr:unnamed protein product [Dracunculus medinensis]